MERLTKVDNQSRLLVYTISDTGLPTIIMRSNPYHELIKRLKVYEDSGLEPSEIEELRARDEVLKMYKPNPNIYCCPACGEKIVPMWDYCPWCGQHVTDD